MTKQSIARISPFSHTKGPYYCQYEWPEDSFLQCGDSGIVIVNKKIEEVALDLQQTAEVIDACFTNAPLRELSTYRTAYFEAFLQEPDTFIRGEGNTIAAAEADAWQKLDRYNHCSGPNGHEFEARGYTNGGGFCRFCGLFRGKVIPSPYSCKICGEKTWYTKDCGDQYYCEKHSELIPYNHLTKTGKILRILNYRDDNLIPDEVEDEEIDQILTQMTPSEEKNPTKTATEAAAIFTASERELIKKRLAGLEVELKKITKVNRTEMVKDENLTNLKNDLTKEIKLLKEHLKKGSKRIF